MNGSIGKERQRDGSIRYRVRLYVEGERRSYGLYETMDAAEDALAAALEQRGALASGTTLRTWGDAWLSKRERSGRVRGIAKERRCWDKHVTASELGAMPLTRVRRKHVVAFLEAIADTTSLSRQTIAHVRRLVIGAFESAIDAGRVDENPARGARLPFREESAEESWTWLTQAEIDRVLALPVVDAGRGARRRGTVTPMQHAAFVVAVFAGLRAGELWGLRWRDVILDDHRPELVVRLSRDLPTKNGKTRRVPMLAAVWTALAAWKAIAPGVGDAIVFPADDRRPHRDGYDAGWARVKRLAGITDRRVRWHDLRHTCASHLVSGTWGRAWRLEEVRDFLGHESIKTTQRYAHLAPGGLHDAAKATGQRVASVVSLNVRAADATPRRDT